MKRHPPSPTIASLLTSLGSVPDPRVNRTLLHPLVNVLTMSLCAVISGAEGWDDVAAYAALRAAFFATFLEMPNGTPSADTFRRVFEALDPRAFQEAFQRWLEPFLGSLAGQTIAMDGKALRGAIAHAAGHAGAFHLMHVWATEQRLLLAQKAVDGAPGELQAAVELLKLLDIKGATVTADANSCTSEITRTIRQGGGHYVLALKGNRSALHKHVTQLFDEAADDDYRGVATHSAKDEGHGRIEFRMVRALPVDALPPRMKAAWCDLRTVVAIDRVRTVKTTTLERSYYITSHKPDPKLLADKIRRHWSIENQLHHCLDVTFGDDRRRIHDENAAQNFALLARHALSLIKREPTKKSVAMKRRMAAWSHEFLLQVLSCGFAHV